MKDPEDPKEELTFHSHVPREHPAPPPHYLSTMASSPTLAHGGNAWLVDPDHLAALKATATALCAPGKGFLASDESAGPWLRAGHAGAKKIPDTVENRAAYRSLCYKTPGLSESISGVILHTETLYQVDADGKKMVDLINAGGMIPGIKLDQGYDKTGIPGTKVGPLGHPETMDKGLDTLRKRAADAYAAGARFAKWRNGESEPPPVCWFRAERVASRVRARPLRWPRPPWPRLPWTCAHWPGSLWTVASSAVDSSVVAVDLCALASFAVDRGLSAVASSAVDLCALVSFAVDRSLVRHGLVCLGLVRAAAPASPPLPISPNSPPDRPRQRSPLRRGHRGGHVPAGQVRADLPG